MFEIENAGWILVSVLLLILGPLLLLAAAMLPIFLLWCWRRLRGQPWEGVDFAGFTPRDLMEAGWHAWRGLLAELARRDRGGW